MKILFLVILSFTLQAIADEDCALDGLPNPPIKDIQAALPEFAATDKQVMSAACKTKVAPSEQVMLALIEESESGSKEDKTVNNVEFKGESGLMLKMFERLTSKWNLSNKKIEPQANIQNLYKINPDCTRVACAMEKIWGKNLSRKLSYLYLKYGMNGSELSFANSSRFKEDELSDVLISLQDFPSKIMPITGENQKMIHYTRGAALTATGGGELAGNHSVELFDVWSNSTGPDRQQTFFHETSHNIFKKFTVKELDEWARVRGWERQNGKLVQVRKECNLSAYAMENGNEDFAETATAYRYNPRQFKVKNCIEKYKFMKKIFGGIEYVKEENCKGQ